MGLIEKIFPASTVDPMTVSRTIRLVPGSPWSREYEDDILYQRHTLRALRWTALLRYLEVIEPLMLKYLVRF